MTNLPNIVSMHNRTAIPADPLQPAEQGASGFMDMIIRQLQEPQESSGINLTGKTDPAATLKDLVKKITGLLQKDGAILPASMQKMAPEDLAAAIAAMLQKNGALPQELSQGNLAAKIIPLLQTDVSCGSKISASLVSDLATQVFSQIQAPQQTPVQFANANIADILEGNKSLPAADMSAMPDSSDIAKQQDANAGIDPVILQQLKDKVAQLQLAENAGANDGAGDKAIIKLKGDIIQALKDQGLDQPAIAQYLASLVRFLRHNDGPPSTDKPEEQQVTTAAAIDRPPVIDAVAVAVAENQMPSQHNNNAAAEPHAPQVMAPPDAVKDSKQLIEPPKFDAPHAVDKKEASADKPSHSTTAPTASAPTPSVQQNLSAKIAGSSVNPSVINALANSDGGFGSDSFGSGNNGQPQDIINGAGFLKPATTDTINAQNFTNYLAAARSSVPNAITQMVNIQLQRNINAKLDMMTIQLDPADLGRLDIKLKFAKDGSIKAHLSADKPETLALLQKDSHHLEKTLQQSGLDLDENSLSFDLRHQQGQQHNMEGFNGAHDGDADEFSAHMNGLAPEKTLQARIAVQANGYITQSGVNIMV